MQENNSEFKYVFGIVPSRRLGRSLGISPIPHKACNYSCVYCQLGRTTKYVRERKQFYRKQDIIRELSMYLESVQPSEYDVITIVGDGEPTLYSELGSLISSVKSMQNKPVAVISNGGLILEPSVRREMAQADLVLLKFDAWDEESFRKINRALKSITFSELIEAYKSFRRSFSGILLIEKMIIKDFGENVEDLEKSAKLIKKFHPNKVFINVPVRPPAETWVKIPSKEIIKKAKSIISAESIDYLPEGNFKSIEESPYEAIMKIIPRHPMCLHDIWTFIRRRIPKGEIDAILNSVLKDLRSNPEVNEEIYGSNHFFRIKIKT